MIPYPNKKVQKDKNYWFKDELNLLDFEFLSENLKLLQTERALRFLNDIIAKINLSCFNNENIEKK